MTLFNTRNTFKPFEYPWAYDGYKEQQKAHWLPEEVPMRDDVKDWNHKLSPEEKNLLTQVFRFFVQGDISVASGYLHKYIPMFGKQPELAMMLSSFASMEAVHIDAYSKLLETVGMPDTEYAAFMQYQEMVDKYNYVETKTRTDNITDIARTLAIYSGFTEGLQLFSSFAILLNFPRFGKMKGMGQIVTWSIRDETIHVKYMTRLFRTLIEEHPRIWTDEFKGTIYQACRDMVELEDAFINLAFEQGGIQGLTKEEVMWYIRFIADRRLLQLGLKPNYLTDLKAAGYKAGENPLPWIDEQVTAVEHSNFFETRATEYSKASATGWDDLFKS